MQKYDVIEKGIDNNDVKSLREAIGSMCYINRDFSNPEFFEVIEYVESKGIKLKDDNLKGTTISSQKSEFNDEDFIKAIFELKKNFCDKRIEDVETIGKKLYGKKVAPAESIESRNTFGKDPNQKGHQDELSKKKIAIIGLVALIIVVLILISHLLK